MKYNCPNCGSENTQSIPMAYRSGTSTGTSRSSTSGVAINSGHLFRPTLFGADTTTAVTNQTLLAGQFEPPKKKEVAVRGCFTALMVMLGLMIALGCFASDAQVGGVTVLAMTVGIGWWCFSEEKSAKEHNEKHFARLAEWNARWVCLRCGHIGPFGDQPTTVDAVR